MQESPFSRRYDLLVWKVALAVVAVDAVSKAWALWVLSATPGRFPGISLQVSYNTDAVFWLGVGSTPVVAILTVLVVGVLAVLARGVTSWPWAFAAGLAAGGGTGNLIDRLARPPGFFHGAVVEWIDTAWIAPFNLADVALSLAAVMAASLGRGRGRG